MALSVVTWLLVARPGVPSTRFLCSVKAAGATITLDSDLDGAAGDVTGDVVEADIMLD